MEFEDVSRYLIEMITAIGVRYDFGDGWRDRIDHVVDVSHEWAEPAALLRPDGTSRGREIAKTIRGSGCGGVRCGQVG